MGTKFHPVSLSKKPLLAQWSYILSALNLVNQACEADDLKGLKDSDNPLDPARDVHDRLKKFINAHSGFNQDSPQDHLNLFAFVRNPPYEMLRKVEEIMNFDFQNIHDRLSQVVGFGL